MAGVTTNKRPSKTPPSFGDVTQIMYENLVPGARERRRENEAMDDYEALGGRNEELYNDYITQIEESFANNPQLNLSSFQDILSGLNENLSDVSRRTRSGVGRYLSEGNEYTSSMLDEIMSSTGDYLTGYKRLARSEMPGVDIYRDQIGSSLANDIQTMKSVGGGSQNSLVQMLKGKNQNMANLALEAGKYKTGTQKDLANAYLTSGQTRGNALGQAANFAQNAAGITTNLGNFESNVLGQQANIANTGAQLTNLEFQNNEMIPWVMENEWNQNQATQFNPVQFLQELYANQIGYFDTEGDEQTEAMQGMMNSMMSLYQSQVNQATSVIGGLLLG